MICRSCRQQIKQSKAEQSRIENKTKEKLRFKPRPHQAGGIRKTALYFLRLGLPSTLICHENGAFQKHALFKREEFKNAGFAY